MIRADFTWLTLVSHYDEKGFVHEDPIALSTCDVCGAVVKDSQVWKHYEWHAES